MEEVIRELNLDRKKQAIGFQQQWSFGDVRIITVGGADIGWMQSMLKDGAILLAQLFVEASFQRRGIGSEVIGRLIDEATADGLPVTLSVARINPAVKPLIS
jgi:GNAT superfamily N-acetyltransferase